MPPPGVYQLQSDFERTSYKNVSSIGPGRDQVTFGSFLLEALKRTKNSPSPDRYNPQVPKSSLGGGMGQRIKTDPNVREKKDIPGPGTYKLTSIEIANQGRYALSNFKYQLTYKGTPLPLNTLGRSPSIGIMSPLITTPLRCVQSVICSSIESH